MVNARAMSLIKKIIISSLLALSVAASGAAEVVDRIVAVVNDEVISLSELELMSRSIQAQEGLGSQFKDDKAIQRKMLEALIDQKLAKAEAKRRGITVSDKDLAQALEDFKRQSHLADDAALTQALSKAGMTLNEFKQKIKDQITQSRLMQVTVGSKVVISNEEMRQFYDTEYPKTGGDRVHLKMISVFYPPGATSAQKEEVRQKAEIILKEFREGVSLETLRKRHSLPMQDLGFITESDLDPTLAEFLRRFKPGQVGPIETPQGFQLVQLVARRSGEVKTFEEAMPEIKNILMQQKMGDHFNEWIKGLRDKAHIKMML